MDFSIFSTKVCEKKRFIIGVQWGQGNPSPRVHRSSGKRGFAEFPTGTVDPVSYLIPFSSYSGSCAVYNMKKPISGMTVMQ